MGTVLGTVLMVVQDATAKAVFGPISVATLSLNRTAELTTTPDLCCRAIPMLVGEPTWQGIRIPTRYSNLRPTL